MANFAEIDDSNIVVRVLSVPDEQEHRGEEYLSVDCGLGGKWIQTSYNGNIRKNYAGIGWRYYKTRDAFVEPKPYKTWVLNEDTCQWEPPKANPNDGMLYYWDEGWQDWILVEDQNGPVDNPSTT
jgi:hypothetical protein